MSTKPGQLHHIVEALVARLATRQAEPYITEIFQYVGSREVEDVYAEFDQDQRMSSPFLGLVHEYLHSRSEPFLDEWLVDRASNRLGRIVFLGTPFLTKDWPDLTKTARGLFALLTQRLIDLSTGAVVTYTMVVLTWEVLRIFGLPLHPVWHPMRWHLVTILIFAGLLAAAWPIFRTNRASGFNLYFQRPFLTRRPRGAARPAAVSAIAINAGMLDEVFLALAAEPFAYSGLMPVIRELLSPKVRWQVPVERPGWSGSTPGSQVTRVIATSVLWFRNALWLFGYPVIALSRHALIRFIKGLIVRAATAGIHGLDPAEVSVGRVVARGSPDVVWIDCDTWDVGRLLAVTPPSPGATARGGGSPELREALRFAFLWDADVFAQRLRMSEWWPMVESSVPEMWRERSHFDGENAKDLRRRLALVTMTAEERLRELRGLVGLRHSGYLTNSTIAETIAKFILMGSKPETARASE